MASTSSGSYLISKTAVAAAQASYFIKPPVIEKPPPLPEPDWSLLRLENNVQYLSRAQLEDQQEKLTNRSQAQLIVQGIGLTKLMESLEVKEKKKTTDRSTLFPGGNGRVLTNSDFIKAMEDWRQMQVDEEEGRRQRQAARAEKRKRRCLRISGNGSNWHTRRPWMTGMWNVHDLQQTESQRKISPSGPYAL
ncbi:hypothetical protein F5888DRAFT_1634908 [Russula emetica]|nr:hypothetical protein F5888DRAFT_1634908 [Russula emetica]